MKITIKEYDIDGYGADSGESRFEATTKTDFEEWGTSQISGRGDTRAEAIADFYLSRDEAAAYRDRFNKWVLVRDNPVSVEEIEA